MVSSGVFLTSRTAHSQEKGSGQSLSVTGRLLLSFSHQLSSALFVCAITWLVLTLKKLQSQTFNVYQFKHSFLVDVCILKKQLILLQQTHNTIIIIRTFFFFAFFVFVFFTLQLLVTVNGIKLLICFYY